MNIPPAALEAGARIIWARREGNVTAEDLARATFTAMVEAWEGSQRVKGYFTHDTDYYEPALILPLMENPDDKA